MCNQLSPERVRKRLQDLFGGQGSQGRNGLLSRLIGPRRLQDADFDERGREPYGLQLPSAMYHLFWLEVRGNFLAIPFLPNGGSRGLFATDGDELLPLSPEFPSNVHTVIAVQGSQPPGSAEQLAQFAIDALLSDRASQPVLVSRAEEVSGFRWGGYAYRVNECELSRIEAAVVPPAVTLAADGWTIDFSCLAGWQFRKDRLLNVSITFRFDFPLEIRQELLSKSIFRSIPAIRI